ncbi:tripartite tricarboxylate transporter permease, partial [Pasteurella multocida subsp. multocida]
QAEKCVNTHAKGKQLPQGAFEALTSITFNVGCGKMQNPLANRGMAQKALNVALYASFVGGIVSALVLLFLAPEVAKVALKMGSPEYFLICAFGLTIIAGVSGESLLKGIISGCLGLFLSFIGMDLISGSTMRFAFDNINLYGGFDLVVVLIGLFALIEIINKGRDLKSHGNKQVAPPKLDKGTVSKSEWLRLPKPLAIGSLSGILVGIIPGTGASIASFLSYDFSRKVSKKPEEFGKGSVEGIAAAECANNAITGTALVPLLTLGIPGDAAVALMLGALMINGLTPGPNLFQNHGTAVYAIMIGLIFVNIFMLIQGKYLLKFFAKVVKIPQQILIPIIAVFCFAGAYSLKESMFDVGAALVFGIIAYLMDKLGFSAVPTLLGLVLGALTEKNLRRALLISDGDWTLFLERPFSLAFCILILVTIMSIVFNNYKKAKKGY